MALKVVVDKLEQHIIAVNMSHMTRVQSVSNSINDHDGQRLSGQQTLDPFPFGIAARDQQSRT